MMQSHDAVEVHTSVFFPPTSTKVKHASIQDIISSPRFTKKRKLHKLRIHHKVQMCLLNWKARLDSVKPRWQEDTSLEKAWSDSWSEAFVYDCGLLNYSWAPCTKTACEDSRRWKNLENLISFQPLCHFNQLTAGGWSSSLCKRDLVSLVFLPYAKIPLIRTFAWFLYADECTVME